MKQSRRLGVENPLEIQVVNVPTKQLETFRASNILKGRNDVEFEPEDFLIPLNYNRGRAPVSLTGNLLSDAKTQIPENILYDKVNFSGHVLDTADPIVRRTVIDNFKQRYPNFIRTMEDRAVVGGDKYYLVGKFPYDKKIELTKNLMKQRLDNTNPD